MARKILFWLSFIFGLLILAILLYFSGFEKTLDLFQHLNLAWIGIAFLVYNLNWVIRGNRFRKIIQGMNLRIPLLDAISITLIGNMANVILPAKIGDLLKPAVLKKKFQFSYVKGLAGILLDRIFDFAAVTVLTAISLALLLPLPLLPDWINSLIWISLGLLGVIVIVGLGMVYTPYFKKIIDWLVSIPFLSQKKELLSSTFNEVRQIFNFSNLSILFLQSIVLWIFEAIITFFAFFALTSQQVNPLVILFAVMIANLTKTLPLTPEGIGVYQAAIAGIFLAAGLPFELGLALGVLDHAIKILYTVVAGFLSALYLGYSFKDLDQLAKESDKGS